MSNKRKQLGFDESDEEEEAPVVRKQLKLPKLSLNIPQSEEIDDEKPVLNVDYLNMRFEDKPIIEKPIQKSRLELTKERMNTSLFGKIIESNDSNELRKLPNNQLKSKGLSIMEKMGFKIGQTLGKENNKNAILEPIVPNITKDKAILKESKKEINESDTIEFRNRLKNENDLAKLTKVIHRMQKYCYEFSGDSEKDILKLNPIDINVLWRGYVIYIQELLRERNNEVEEKEEAKEEPNEEKEETDNESKGENHFDEELDLFEQLTLEEKLQRLNLHLRSEYNYCYYCGVRYEDQKDLFKSCPGDSFQDHE